MFAHARLQGRIVVSLRVARMIEAQFRTHFDDIAEPVRVTQIDS